MPVVIQDANSAMSISARDPSVHDIIAAARSKQRPTVDRPRSLAVWGLSFLTAGLLWLSFTPVDAGPLAWIALAPIILLIRLPQPTRWMYTALFVTGLVNFVATLQWMRYGDPTMIIAMVALAAYCAAYFPIFVALSRFAHHRWGLPLVLAVPVIWTGMEYARAHIGTGFAWYFLSHTQYRWLELIQISDITGAYGVSFIVAMGNAALAGLVSVGWLRRLGLLTQEGALLQSTRTFRAALVPVLITAVTLGGVLGYGMLRRHQAEFTAGPRVALIQGNFVASLRQKPPEPEDVYITHARLTGMAVREQPDLIVWPEAMFPAPLVEADPALTTEQLVEKFPNIKPEVWTDGRIRRDLGRESQKAGAALLWGIHAMRAESDGLKQFNSAAFVTPEMGLVGRYDKRHLVPFGEYLPLRNVLPFLQFFTPYGGNSGLQAGVQPAVFEYKSWRFAPVICFEDTVPHVVRTAAAAGLAMEQPRPVDVLVNLTNDGWFHGSSELDQHLITAAFRAVECRAPMVRAVNTGLSAIIDGDGAILEPDVFIDGDRRRDSDLPPRTSTRDPKTGKRHRQMTAALIHTVPLDNRSSLYVRFGDWFAGACCLFVTATLVMMIRQRRRVPATVVLAPRQ